VSLPVAILAGGLASRLLPLTTDTPKSLIPIKGRPFAEYQLELLRRNGFRTVIFCVGHHGDQIEQCLGDGARYGMAIRYVYDGPTLLGTGGALRRALPLLGDAFLVMYGDSYLDCPYADIADAFLSSNKSGLMTILRNQNRWDRSNVRYDGHAILMYDKSGQHLDLTFIDYGLGALRADVLKAYPENTRFDLAEVYAGLVSKHDLAAYEVTERFFEIGSFVGIQELEAKLERDSGDLH
jgi:N-acetyl-alpha-D-muramate 1-phosphate uridylyltransferase